MAGERDELWRAADDPKQRFGTPKAVLDAADLADEEKIAILERWRLDALRLADSESEGMGGGENTEIDEVERLLLRLKGG